MRVAGRQVVEHINGVEYQTMLLPAGKNFTWSVWLTKTFLPAFGAGIDGVRNGESMFETNAMFTEMALHLVGRVDEDKTFMLVKDLLGNLFADGKQVQFDEYFAGEKMADLLLVLEWLMRENFAGFFTNPALKAKLMNLRVTLFGNPEQPQESNDSPA
jgi:hypothetical protein